MSTQRICIYHANCADGFTAAWVVRYALSDNTEESGAHNTEFFPGKYGEEPPDVTGKEVVIVDFSYPLEIMERLVEQAVLVTVIDHHKTAQKNLEPLLLQKKIHGVFDMNKSGAMLAWEWFLPCEPAPEFIEYVQDRDLWRFELPESKEFSAGLFSHPYDFKLWDEFVYCDSDAVHNLKAAGRDILRKHFKDIHEFIEHNMRYITIVGYTIPVVNLPYFFASDAANILAEKQPFAACYWDTAEGVQFSLRSNKDGIDVSEIAELFGGGGHKHAAGFTLNYLPLQGVEILQDGSHERHF